MNLRVTALLAIVCVAQLTGCVASVGVRAPVAEVVVARPPPAPRAEPPAPPPPGDPAVFVWQPGHWRWDGHEYQWNPGHYEKRPARAARWVPAEWIERGGQWVFHPGHWQYQ